MASGVVRLADVIVPAIFAPYVQQLTAEKSRLIQSGAIYQSAFLDAFLSGQGLTINMPSFLDLDDDPENVSTDDPTQFSTPNKIESALEVAVRCSRNNSWSEMDLVASLMSPDPMEAIANRVAAYWVRRFQQVFIAVINGVYASNAAATDAYHVQNDMSHDVSGSAFSDGVTNITAENVIDTALTMGDSMEDLTMIMMHSIVYGRLQKNNLIDFIPDARGEITIPTYLGRQVIVDDGMPNAGGVFNTWLFGSNAVQWGRGSPKVPVETFRTPSAGNGGGQDTLYSRVEFACHPTGNAYIGTPPNGGPSNAATTNNLAAAGSWRRIYMSRKQIRMARLVTREM